MRKITFVASGYGSWPAHKPDPAKLKPADLEKLIQKAVEARLPVEVEKALLKQRAEDEYAERARVSRSKSDAAYMERHNRECAARAEKEKSDLEARLDAWERQNPGHGINIDDFIKGKPIETASAPTQLPKWYRPIPD
jgi:hypothetical protein